MSLELSLDRRRAICKLIAENPGLHLRELERKLRIGLGDLRYHLEFLIDAGLIVSVDEGYRRTFFPVNGFSYSDAPLMSLLRQGPTRKILLILLEHKGLGFRQLQEMHSVSKSTLFFHLRKLIEARLVLVSREEGRAKYTLSNPKHVVGILCRYKESFFDESVDRVVSAWMP